ncbi:MAG TPA: YybS family protein [Bacillales bacterium]|nr:YybS family protein [Bacillales bacterium]
MKRSNRLTEGAMAAALYGILLILALYVPVVSIVSVWFLPLPFIVYIIRNGTRSALPLWGCGMAIGLLFGSIWGLFFSLLFASGGTVAGILYRQKRPAFGILLGGALTYTAGVILVYILTIVIWDLNLINQTVETMRQAMRDSQSLLHTMGGGSQRNLEMFEQQLALYRYLAPALLAFAGATYALITQLAATPVLRKIGLGDHVLPWKPFREWQFPKSFLWYYLIILIIGFFHGFEAGSVGSIVYYNLLVVLQVVMFIQGLSFVFFYMHLRKWSKGLKGLTLILLVLLSVATGMIFRLVGVIDLGFQMRDRLRSS